MSERMVDKISIIIPTHNRPNYLKRIIDYYNKNKINYNIIIADSSSDENKRLNKKIVSFFQGLDTFYISHYSEKINPSHKLIDAINHVKTKYCVLCADDDFITPKGIQKAVDFLEKNPDFTVAHGYYTGFRIKRNLFGKRQFCWRPIYAPQSIVSSDPKERLLSHLANYYPTFYGVHQTNFLKMIFEESLKFTNDYIFGELLLSMLTLIYGKSKYLDIFYSARESNISSTSRTSQKITDFIKEKSYTEKYNQFKKCLVNHLMEKAQINNEEADKIIEKGMKSYLEKYYLATNSKISNFVSRLKLPIWLEEKMKSAYRLFFSPKQVVGFQNHLDPSFKYYEDLNQIRSHLLLNNDDKNR